MKYETGDLLADLLLSIAIPLFRRLRPEDIGSASRMMGRIAPFLLRGYRERVITHLSIAYEKEKNKDEIRTLMKQVFYHIALTGLETVYGLANPTECLRKLEIQGRNHLDAALARGKGIIAVGAHFGSFTLLGSRLGLEGYKVNIIIEMGHFPKIWSRINRLQRLYGEEPFPARPLSLSLKRSLNCLRRNEVLYVIADQQQRRGGIPVPFFGKLAYTPPGPAILSLKTGAPVLPMFVLRGDGLKRKLVIGEPLPIERSDDEKKDLERLTAKLTGAIEEMVRRHPCQWAWINRRWKSPH